LQDTEQLYEYLSAINGKVTAVAAGTLLDGSPVLISGTRDGTVQARWLNDAKPYGEALQLSVRVRAIALHEDTLVIATGNAISVHHMDFH
jgi:hypothetical protein